MKSSRIIVVLSATASILLQPAVQAGRFSFTLPKKVPTQAPRRAPHVEVPAARAGGVESSVIKSDPKASLLSEAARTAIYDAIVRAIEEFNRSSTREDKRFYVEEAFRQLERWHQDITARRATLDLRNQIAIQAFNDEAARYHQAVKNARLALAALSRPA